MFFLLLLGAIVIIIVTVFIINNSYTNAVKKAQINIISSLNEAAIIIDAKANILLFNDAAEKITGMIAKNAVGQPIDTILKLFTDQTPVPYSLYGKPTHNNSQNFTFSLHKENGDKTDILLTVAKSVTGKSDQTLITLLDTSKEKQLEEMKVDFVSMAGYE